MACSAIRKATRPAVDGVEHVIAQATPADGSKWRCSGPLTSAMNSLPRLRAWPQVLSAADSVHKSSAQFSDSFSLGQTRDITGRSAMGAVAVVHHYDRGVRRSPSSIRSGNSWQDAEYGRLHDKRAQSRARLQEKLRGTTAPTKPNGPPSEGLQSLAR